MSLEALGYEFEAMVLFLANLDIGTCWLGGTFDRQGFSEAMNVGSDEVFPIITPYGYAADDKHEKEIEMRRLIQADHRKDWSQLFFDGDFNTALTIQLRIIKPIKIIQIDIFACCASIIDSF